MKQDKITRVSGEDFFKLINDQKKYQTYIEEEIKYIDDNFNSLSSYELKSSMNCILHDFGMYGSCFDLSKLPVLDFLNRYDKYFLEVFGGRLNILFELNHFDLQEEYIKKHYNELKNEFQKKYIAFSHFNNLSIFDVFDDEYHLMALFQYGEEEAKKRELFIVPQTYKANPLTYLLFKYFRDDIIFLYPEGVKDYYLGFYFDLTWKYYKKILVNLESEGKYDDLNKLISNIIYNLKIFSKYDDVEDCFMDFVYIEKIFKLLRFFVKTQLVDTYYIDIYDTFKFDEACMLKNTKASTILASRVLSNEFFANINYLKTISKADLPNDKVYQNGIKIFNEFFLEYFPFLTKLTPQINRRIFNRVIAGNSIFDILKIISDISLLHFYRFGEIVNLSSNDLDENIIYETNYREYMDIKRICREKYYLEQNNTFYIQDHERKITLITYNLLSTFGYNRAKRILLTSINFEIIKNISELKFIDEKRKKKFIDVLFNDLKLTEKHLKDKKIAKNISVIFESLYSNDFKPLTLEQIVKRAENFECYLTPNTQKIIDNLLLLNQVSKGDPLANKVNAIKLYDEYRIRKISSIPDINGIFDNLEYSMVDMHSPEIISNGIGKYMYPNANVASSCLTPAGKAASCMEHGATNPNGRFFKVTINGKIVAYSWVWRAGDILCFDNIEVTEESKAIPNFNNLLLRIYRQASKDIIDISSSSEEKPIKAALVGCNPIDVLADELSNLTSIKSIVKENFKPNKSDKLYLEDSKNNQYLLYGIIDESTSIEEREPIYKYKRPKIKKFSDISYKELKLELNSIYFDYCLYTNKSYTSLKDEYESGYLGEDWFIGYKNDGTYDIYYANPTEETLQEIQEYVDLDNVIIKPKIYVAKDYSSLDYYLSSESYVINTKDLNEYLKSIKEVFSEYSKNGYFHSTSGDIKKIGCILLDGAITSSVFGNHPGGGGNNGSHFICVAEIGSVIYQSYCRSEGFIINPNICTFKTGIINVPYNSNEIIDSRCIIRPSGGTGERQVLDYISLDSVDCMTVDPTSLDNIAKILYIQEYTKHDIPLVTMENFKKIDKKELKRLIKLK